MEGYLEGGPLYRVRYRVFLESWQELVSSTDSPGKCVTWCRVFPGLCPSEISVTLGRGAIFDARNSESCRFSRARFGADSNNAIGGLPPRHRSEIRCAGRIFCGYG